MDDVPDYQRALDEAVLQWGSNSGETTAWARRSLQGLLEGSFTELELAVSVYKKLRPTDARGNAVVPRMRKGTLSVRNLENTTCPVQGAAAARRSLEAVLLLYRFRFMAALEIEEFLSGQRKLFPLFTELRKLAKDAHNAGPHQSLVRATGRHQTYILDGAEAE